MLGVVILHSATSLCKNDTKTLRLGVSLGVFEDMEGAHLIFFIIFMC